MNGLKRFCGFEVTLQPERRQFPSEIVPGFLYLGDASDATSADTLRSFGIRRVVNCAGIKCRYVYTNSIHFCCLFTIKER